MLLYTLLEHISHCKVPPNFSTFKRSLVSSTVFQNRAAGYNRAGFLVDTVDNIQSQRSRIYLSELEKVSTRQQNESAFESHMRRGTK